METEKTIRRTHDTVMRCVAAHAAEFDFCKMEVEFYAFIANEIPALLQLERNGVTIKDMMIVAMRAAISDWNHSEAGKTYLLDREWLIDHATVLLNEKIGPKDEQRVSNLQKNDDSSSICNVQENKPHGTSVGKGRHPLPCYKPLSKAKPKTSHVKWSQDNIDTLCRLRIQGVPYKKIVEDHFPQATVAALQGRMVLVKGRAAEILEQLKTSEAKSDVATANGDKSLAARPSTLSHGTSREDARS